MAVAGLLVAVSGLHKHTSELEHLKSSSTHRSKLFAAVGHHIQFDSGRKQQPHIRQQTWQADVHEPSH